MIKIKLLLYNSRNKLQTCVFKNTAEHFFNGPTQYVNPTNGDGPPFPCAGDPDRSPPEVDAYDGGGCL